MVSLHFCNSVECSYNCYQNIVSRGKATHSPACKGDRRNRNPVILSTGTLFLRLTPSAMNNRYPHSFTGILLILTTYLASSGFQAQAATATSRPHFLFRSISGGRIHDTRASDGMLFSNCANTTEHGLPASTAVRSVIDPLPNSSALVYSGIGTGNFSSLKISFINPFKHNAGDNIPRFIFSQNKDVSVPGQNQRNDFTIYYSEGGLYIQPLKSIAEYTVIISNLIGQTLHKVKHTGSDLYRLDLELSPSIYIVTIEANGSKFSKKIPVR